MGYFKKPHQNIFSNIKVETMILIDCVKARMKTTEFQPKPIKYGISNDIFWNFRILLPSDQWPEAVVWNCQFGAEAAT